ncbi:MAG TPA: hypothetical protein VK898_12355 [Chloroflexota bacterium]|nr:hypothetical protein [Chloroflexota bacterium]
MTRVQAWTRMVLLGPDDSWGATLATGPRGIYTLAALALAMHVLDLATGLRMMLLYGVHLEQNPLARFVMASAGPLGLMELKLGVVIAGLVLFVRTARAGRARLARNCLLIAVGIGLLGWASNLVG